MEKKLAITVIILTTIINAFFCLHVGNDVIDKWLFDKTTVSDLNKVFIIKTTNFERSGENITRKNEENIDYTYKINVKNKEDLYSPYGRNIVVDKNYLKRHPIKDTMGKNVINAIEDKENVLNILVPLKFKTYEDIIKSSFKEWFYFQKVEVANIYREAKSQNIIEGNVDGLKVNIIYIENGQRLHPIFDMAVRDDIIRKNPTDGVLTEIKRNSGKNKGIRHALTIEQQQAFMDTIRTFPEYYHWYPLFATLLGTGMRIGECIGLTWNDIDFKKRCISVNHAATYYTRNGVAGFAISRPKTEAGIRQIPMMDAVYNALKNEYDRQKKDGFCTYELDDVSGFIFSNKLGLLHNPHCVNLAIKRIYEAHNAREIIDAKREHREPIIIPHFSCHVLRHTFCSRLCESDMNVKVIQEIMGHKNVETTLDIYTEVNYNKKRDSLEELANKMTFF